MMIEKKICAVFRDVPGAGVKGRVILGLLASHARASGVLVRAVVARHGGAGRRPAGE